MTGKDPKNVHVKNTARKVLNVPAPLHQFREPKDIAKASGGTQLLIDLIATKAFQPLKEVHFLGAIDYSEIPHPNGQSRRIRYTRYQHSIGVMQLALFYAQLRNINTKRQEVLAAAALLHDIGHPPLSHTVEPVFKQTLGIDHHSASIDIIRGKIPLGTQVFGTLVQHAVDIDELIAVLSGQDSEFEGFFSGPINFDTIEGILRSYRYKNDSPTCLDPVTVTEAATLRETTRHRKIVDAFWQHKDWVYHNLINAEKGILSDHVCRMYLQDRITDVNEAWFFIGENELFRRLKGLKDLLLSDAFEERALRYVDTPIPFTKRHYFVDNSGDFFHWKDALRYKHTRNSAELQTRSDREHHSDKTNEDAQKELFDDRSL